MLQDRSLLREQKLVENAKFKNSNATIWVIFKHCAQALIRRPTRLIGPCFTWPKIQMCSREFKENWIRRHQLREQKCEKWMTDETRLIPKPHCMKSNVKGTFYPWQCFITLIGNAQLWFTSWQFCSKDGTFTISNYATAAFWRDFFYGKTTVHSYNFRAILIANGNFR